MRSSTAALLLLLIPAIAFAQRDAKVPDPDPELERKTFVVAPGFEVNLFAADPLLAKPIQMNFDPQGRLWVASSEIYPQIKPGEKANDKIIVLEDKDGDGMAETTTVFADGLLIPTGVEPGDGGAYVANSTELVHLSASEPGKKADRTKVLLSGFGTEDTHHIIHTFRWGPDCRLYFTQSIYIHSHIETPTGVKRLNAGGIWRFDPDRTDLDVFARGWVNSWGHAFDKFGQSFVTDGAGGEGINHAVPGAYYMTSVGPHAQRILHGLNPGSPKHCGLEVVSGRHFPDDWQGDLITNDFRGHRVCRFKLQDDGSTYASREMTEVIKSNHPAFRPIDVKMGPDGALYIADWYNPIIQHGEVDFRDPRRDKAHGRIWRVTAKGRPLVPRPKLVDATIPELLEMLKAPEDWTRQQAKRVLKERGKDAVLPHLVKWADALDPKDANTERLLLEAAWVDQGFRTITDDWLKKLRTAKSPEVRAAAVRILAEMPVHATRDEWQALATDPHPRVRLEAIRGLAQFGDIGAKTGIRSGKIDDLRTRAVEVALSALDKPMDRTLDYALWLTVRELEPHWMPEFQSGKLTFGGDAKKLAFALDAVGSKDAVAPVRALLAGGKVPKDKAHGLWLLLARIGGPDDLGKALEVAAAKETAAAERDTLAAAVEEAVRTRKVGKPADVAAVRGLLSTDADAARRAAARLAGHWKLEDCRKALAGVAGEKKASPADRQAALDGLVLLGGERTLVLFESLTDGKTADPVKRQVIATWAGVSLPTAAGKAAAFLATAQPADELTELYAAFVGRKGGAAALAKALAGKKLPPDVAKLGLRAVRAAAAQDAGPLADTLAKAGGLGAARKEPTPDEVRALVAEAEKTGDPARGEAVFRRKDMQCLACHAIGGAGGQVGPDMTSLGASAQLDYLVESLLLPNKAIKEGYHALRVVTVEDRVLTGVKVREGDGVLVLRNEKDEQVTIPLKDIAERGNTRSLMPDGQTDPLTKQEFADLVRFMSELGKVGPYAPSRARVVRRWQLIEPTPQNMNLFRRTRVSAASEPATPFTWSPVYSRVSGDLPLGELPKMVVWNDTAPLAVVRFQLDVTAAGAAVLKFNSTDGLTLYSGVDPVEVKAETPLDLKAGVQTLTLVIDRTKRTDDVRVELDDVPGSPARAAVVGGK
jgi:putative heme-binding domain-containing protein